VPEYPKRAGADFFGTPEPVKKRVLKGFHCLSCGRELPPFEPEVNWIDSDRHMSILTVEHFHCPFCEQLSATMRYTSRGKDGAPKSIMRTMIPLDRGRRALPDGIPDSIEHEYRQASAILEISPMASAAMSRRCLQSFLGLVAGAMKRNLEDAIEEVIATSVLPDDLASELHAVREIGNFAAHAMKSVETGAILEVEPGEAEWNLEVLEHLFDFYFTDLPARTARRASLEEKLREAGRRPLGQARTAEKKPPGPSS
jgi:hypothetical protein